jgi:hypothetical protein
MLASRLLTEVAFQDGRLAFKAGHRYSKLYDNIKSMVSNQSCDIDLSISEFILPIEYTKVYGRIIHLNSNYERARPEIPVSASQVGRVEIPANSAPGLRVVSGPFGEGPLQIDE